MCEGIISQNIENRGKIDIQKSLNRGAPPSPLNASNPVCTVWRNNKSLESKIALKFNFKFCAKLFLDQKY